MQELTKMRIDMIDRLQRFRQHRQPFLDMGAYERHRLVYGLEEISNLSLSIRDAVGCRLAGVYSLIMVNRSLINNG